MVKVGRRYEQKCGSGTLNSNVFIAYCKCILSTVRKLGGGTPTVYKHIPEISIGQTSKYVSRSLRSLANNVHFSVLTSKQTKKGSVLYQELSASLVN